MEKYLGGGQPYEGPWGIVYGGNITPDVETGIGDWTEEEIRNTFVSGVRKDGRRLILMPWYAYSSLTQQDADAIAYYLKNELPAVKNEIPAVSLKPDFVVMAPKTESTENKLAVSPLFLVIISILVILLVTLGMVFFRRKTE